MKTSVLKIANHLLTRIHFSKYAVMFPIVCRQQSSLLGFGTEPIFYLLWQVGGAKWVESDCICNELWCWFGAQWNWQDLGASMPACFTAVWLTYTAEEHTYTPEIHHTHTVYKHTQRQTSDKPKQTRAKN